MSNRHDDDSAPPPHTPHPRGRLRKTVKRIFLLSLVAFLIAGAAVVYLLRSEPIYWQQHQHFVTETPPQQFQQLAQDVESKLGKLANLGLDHPEAAAPNRLATAEVDIRQQPGVKPEDVHIDAEQKIVLDNRQLAALVNLRLDDWLNDRGYVKPREIEKPMVTIDDGKLVLGFNFRSGSFSQVLSAQFSLKIRTDGMADLTLNQFLAGRLPIPAGAIGGYLQKISGGDTRAARAGQWLSKLQTLEFKPVLKLDHRRRARVVDYRLIDSGLELTVRVQDHKTYRATNQLHASRPMN